MKNREIKFRAWHIDSKVMFDVLAIAFQNKQIVVKWHGAERAIKYDQFELMQYTGLKDRHGKEIYEGDIVRILYTDWPSNTDPNISMEDYLNSISHIGEVVYDAPEFGILMVKNDRYGERPIGSFNYGDHGRIEVIGSIYQNPDLL